MPSSDYIPIRNDTSRISLSEDLIKSIETLIETREEYTGRLVHIRNALVQGKQIYHSDKEYLESLLGKKANYQQFTDVARQKRTGSKIKNIDLHLFLPFSILILFAITRYVGYFKITIYPTIDRATAILDFARPILGDILFDNIVMTSTGLVTLYFLVKSKIKIPIIVGFGALEVFLIAKNHVGLDIFALFVMPAIATVFIANQFTSKKIIKKRSWKYLLYTGIALIFCFELLVLSVWIAYPFAPNYFKKSIFWYPVVLELELFYAFARLSPYFLILVMYSFLAKPAHRSIRGFFAKTNTHPNDQPGQDQEKISQISTRLAKLEASNKTRGIVDRISTSSYANYLKDLLSLERMKINPNFAPNVLFDSKILLGLGIGISVLFAVYPYLPTINPHYTWISVDDFAYQQFLKEIQSQKTVEHMIKHSFVVSAGDRPISLLIMDAFQMVFGLSVMTAVRFFPVILGPALVLAVYFFVREGIKNTFYAAYAALLTAFSYQVIVGIYAGFMANWLGLVAAFLFFAMLHRFWEKPSAKNYLLVFGHSVLSFSLYIYVDVYLLLTLLAFLIISALKFKNDSTQLKKVLILSSIFAIYAAIFETRVLLGSTGLYTTVFQREDVTFSFREFQNRWLNFPYFMHLYVGGFFANTVPLIFVFVWTIYAKYENTFDRILLAALFVGAIPIIFGDPVLQSRVFYDMPIFVVSALGILRVLNRKNFSPLFSKTAFALITINIAIYTIRSLSNLVIGGT